jgi:hypothetical protein
MRERGVIERGCVIETGTTTRTTAGERWASWPTPGRRPCRALSGGSPDGRAAAAGSAGPHPQVGGPRRHAAPMTAPANTGPSPSSVPGILSPCKITVKGAPPGRVLWMAQAPPLTLIFRGKTSAPIGRTGANWRPQDWASVVKPSSVAGEPSSGVGGSSRFINMP